ncbi:MAG: uracil-DNA glycosylase [Elusimicrobiota bacterium]|jgi:DNA polymerase|nr:uracil-DNA glycosylase [Elusimicrobiota bacterium]
MRKALKTLAGDLRKHLRSQDEGEIILKAAPCKKRAAFKTPETAPAADKAAVLEGLAAQIKTCKRCALGQTRLNAVPGEGNINARLMFIGEGPGYEEDRQGRPFVGKAGQLLDKMIVAMGFTRQEVFIANMVKCHPMIDPQNPDKRGNDRAPDGEEIAVCRRYIERQIAAVSPDYIVALGGVAGKSLIMDAKSLSAIRGKFYDLQLTEAALTKPVKILATFHPAALLRNPGWKKDAWADLKMLLAAMGRTPPSKEV